MSHGIRPTGFKVRIKAERCIHCGKCIKACARKNFRVGAGGGIEIVHVNNCNGCTRCRDVCATKAIAVAPEPMRGSEHVSPVARRDAADQVDTDAPASPGVGNNRKEPKR